MLHFNFFDRKVLKRFSFSFIDAILYILHNDVGWRRYSNSNLKLKLYAYRSSSSMLLSINYDRSHVMYYLIWLMWCAWLGSDVFHSLSRWVCACLCVRIDAPAKCKACIFLAHWSVSRARDAAAAAISYYTY